MKVLLRGQMSFFRSDYTIVKVDTTIVNASVAKEYIP